MKTETVTAYICEHCGKRSFYKRTITRHERVCFKNPDRQPIPGELLSAEHYSKYSCGGWGELPKWWPASTPHRPEHELGKMWNGKAWVSVPGYKFHSDTAYRTIPGESHLWEPDYDFWVDEWPAIEGKPLNEWPYRMRLDWLNGEVGFNEHSNAAQSSAPDA